MKNSDNQKSIENTVNELDQKIKELTEKCEQSENEIKNLKICNENLTKEKSLLEKLYKDQIIEITKEKNNLEEKFKKNKMKVIELSNMFENELNNKKEKNSIINQNNQKLFQNVIEKNKKLVQLLKQVNEQNGILRQEKFELENICLKQEEQIKKFNTNNSNKTKNKKFFNSFEITKVNYKGYNSEIFNYGKKGRQLNGGGKRYILSGSKSQENIFDGKKIFLPKIHMNNNLNVNTIKEEYYDFDLKENGGSYYK